ncbi:DNA-binding transcriptional regulator, XRE-family HTH domain [Succiniclasticum ruminis]|uniref:DNA-binding transcriptional regulator, XRE-family HTH domain n=1 Tax=Succiniclasticum ruminis TaxID=40841 RepID=A0A1G6KPF7_9FIRM|nr:helix-turn-helix transcriptional regulator [Succiniclasticum ruminis]SDC32969.1 DNA-binding transcriptional regulator, XRE-family HTH domain [Succiniclasticum ruminis]
MKINYQYIGQRIRQERLRNRLSQEQLAELTESSPQYISHIETARKKASLEMILKIANSLDVSVDQLIADNLTSNQYKGDVELSRLFIGCTHYERRIILEIATAARYILEEYRWIMNVNKS